MRKVAVVGVGQTKFSGVQEKTGVELFAEAAMDAINEAGLKSEDIQALFLGNVWGDFSEGQVAFRLFRLYFHLTIKPLSSMCSWGNKSLFCFLTAQSDEMLPSE